MNPINRQLPASTSEVIHAVGSYIWLKAATGPVQIKTDEGETAILTAGDFVRTDKPFSEIFVTDLSAAQNNVTFNISESGEAGKYGNVSIDSPATFNDKGDVSFIAATPFIILAADANRSEAIITALPSNAADARIGSSSVGATRGTILTPGGTLILKTTGAIYAYSSAASGFAVTWTGF